MPNGSAPASGAAITADDVLATRVAAPADLEACVRSLTRELALRGRIGDAAGLEQEILNQHFLRSCELPSGVAIPRVSSTTVHVPSLAVTATYGTDREGEARGGLKLVLLLATPYEGADLHLRAWRRMALRAAQPSFRQACAACRSADELAMLVANYIH